MLLNLSTSRFYKYALDDKNFAIRLKTLDIISYYADRDLLIFKSNLDWFESFSVNPNIRGKLTQLGFVDQRQFRLIHLFRKFYTDLFQLAPEIRREYDRLLEIRKRVRNLYCAQIRIGGKREHVNGDFKFNDRNVTKSFWDFIRENFIRGWLLISELKINICKF